MLSAGTIGSDALYDRKLLEEVVAHKQVFFNASYANYDDCLEGKLRLLPDDDDLAGLARDYAKMNQAGMFYASPPSFDDLKQSIADLEELINS